ncbi:streptomycin 6-kinase [Nocardioides ginsengisoli]|uniref:Aminoglycoside phosphotransferase family protein n=1 Tax=Nocardioides ginsengisoli TaxID=363868 RepID=A0ABW3W6J7_9ACTN
MLATLLTDWRLGLDGDADGALLPVTTDDGTRATLRLDANEHEHLALQRWRGRGAVQLLRADPSRHALLVERVGGDLADAWDVEACQTVATLYGVLHVAPMPQLRSQADLVGQRADELRRDARSVPVPRRLVDQALALARDLTADPPTAVLHGDLHFGQVRRGSRDGEDVWLAIAPRPVNGDPHSELEPMLRHRFDEYAAPWAAGSVRDGIRQRFHTLVDTAGLDEDRARDWVVVRSVLHAHRVQHDRDQVTACITVAKAVQD